MLRYRRALLVALLFTVACDLFSPTSIRTILDDPAEYEGKSVLISGDVEESVNVLVLKYFVVRDGTGRIPVVAAGAVPRRGAHVRVRGVVKQAFAIGNDSLTVLIEER